jgi:hypothetical protein
MSGTLAPAGRLGVRKVKAPKYHVTWWEITKAIVPRDWWHVKNFRHVWRGYWKITVARMLRMPHFYGTLQLRLYTPEGMRDYGIVSLRVVTTAFVNYAVDALQADQAFENFKYHGFGTNNTAENASDTGLNTELTTEYAVNSTRPTGSQTEGASANIYRTVGTLDPDSDVAIVEHGIFLAATGATTMMDRSVFSAVNVDDAGDTLEATFDLTLAAGS